MNKLTITDKVFVPVSVEIEDIPSQKTTVFMYDVYGNQIEPYWLKEETNKYVLSKEEIEKLISDAWKANHVDWYYDEKGNKIDNEMQKKQYINSIL
jgi:hypothetical protein